MHLLFHLCWMLDVCDFHSELDCGIIPPLGFMGGGPDIIGGRIPIGFIIGGIGRIPGGIIPGGIIPGGMRDGPNEDGGGTAVIFGGGAENGF